MNPSSSNNADGASAVSATDSKPTMAQGGGSIITRAANTVPQDASNRAYG